MPGMQAKARKKNFFAYVRDKTAEQNVSKKALEFETSGQYSNIFLEHTCMSLTMNHSNVEDLKCTRLQAYLKEESKLCHYLNNLICNL